MLVNYFEFYEIPVSFYLDETHLKKLFFAKSKALHPDFHAQEDQTTQDKILLLSSMNTEAYKVLSNFFLRMEYILKMKEILVEGQSELPKNFLMDMMELNEEIMELQMDFSAEGFEKCKSTVESYENESLKEIQNILEKYEDANAASADLEKIKIFYLKHKYFLRIQKSLSTFAPH